ncbi:hypothetical protein [Massilia niabensis]|uniref:Uncharacterized protein n=1 Tax=Massilia niabensis TaxID=544910 RepID=A0ABW0L0R5_9BURK
MVESNLGDVVEKYEMEIVELNANEVILKTRAYVLDVVADRDGVAIIYFDRDAVPLRGYNVFLYLLKARRELLLFVGEKPVPSTYTDFIDSELASLLQHLRVAAHDILSGSKTWISAYSWPAVRPSPSILAIL